MTQQTQGETLFRGIAGTGASSYAYGPWLHAPADAAVFGVQINNLTADLTLKWSVETKSAADTDAAATALMTDQSETSTGVKYSLNGGSSPVALSGCKELYRYRFATPGVATTTEWVNFRDLSPSWQRNGAR